MAEKKKKAPAKKTSAKKSPPPQGRKKRSAVREETETAEKEIPKQKKAAPQKNDKNQFWSVILFAVGVLVLLMAAVDGSSGWLRIHNGLLGLFGASVFFVPVIFIYTAIQIGMEKSQKCVSKRAVWGVALTFLASAAIQIFFVGAIPGKGMSSHLAALFNAGKRLRGGGVASILIAGPLLTFFGETGAKIISVIMFFVFIMFLTGMGLIELFQLVSKPFMYLGRVFMDFRDMISGSDFEDSFDDEDDSDYHIQRFFEDIDPEPEAEPDDREEDEPESENEPESKPENKASQDEDDYGFLFDAPANEQESKGRTADTPEPVTIAEKTQTETEVKPKRRKKAEREEVFLDENGEPQPPVESLDVLISHAAEKSEVQAEVPDEEWEPVPEEKLQYVLPSIELLTPPAVNSNSDEASAEMREKAETIVNTLKSFGVTVRISNIYRGPAITRYEIQPGAGVKVSRIKTLENDIALYLAARSVRIEAPVPGKAAVGIEVPNTKKDVVTLREILASNEFRSSESKLSFAVGKDIAGNVIIGDVAKMPHVIIAGTTGSGKSVCTRSIIMSILYNARPDEVKLILIDPKIVEFKIFDGIPHLLIPIVTDSKKAAGALNWAVNEMMRRYQLFAEDGANDIKSYNEMSEKNPEVERIPQIVIFIDELADMMLVAGKEVEDSICRLAQMGRAAGMHLVVATQRPTTDVITGLIKANIPSRIALSVMSQIDSRTIIDTQGAEKLLGNGDMLYKPIGVLNPVRVQGCFASSRDMNATIAAIKQQAVSEYDSEVIQAVDNFTPVSKGDKEKESDYAVGSDEDFVERAIAVAVENGQVSTSMLQRKLKLGYARAARIMDELEEMGIIGPSEGAKPRRVLMSKMQFDERRARKNT